MIEVSSFNDTYHYVCPLLLRSTKFQRWAAAQTAEFVDSANEVGAFELPEAIVLASLPSVTGGSH